MTKNSLFLASGITTIFVMFDYFLHYLDFLPANVPGGYFIRKTIFSIIILFILFEHTKIRNIFMISLITAILLQLSYFINYNYDNKKMIITHAILIVLSYYLYVYITKRYKGASKILMVL